MSGRRPGPGINEALTTTDPTTQADIGQSLAQRAAEFVLGARTAFTRTQPLWAASMGV